MGDKRPISISSSDDENSDGDEDINQNTSGVKTFKKQVRVSSSAVHREFLEIKNKEGAWTSQCKHCVIKEKIYNHKNSSALLIHLMNKHPAVYKQCKEDDDKERKDRENQKKEMEHQVKLGKSSQGHTSASQVLFSGQGGPIDKFLKTGTHLPLPYWKQKRIDKKYALWLGGSGLPISAVTDDPNFRGFVAELNPEARLPSRFKVGKDCEQLRSKLKSKTH